MCMSKGNKPSNRNALSWYIYIMYEHIVILLLYAFVYTYEYFVLHKCPHCPLFVCWAWPWRWVRRRIPCTVIIALRRPRAASKHHGHCTEETVCSI